MSLLEKSPACRRSLDKFHPATSEKLSDNPWEISWARKDALLMLVLKRLSCWTYHDRRSAVAVGAFANVVQRCRDGPMLPYLLFYDSLTTTAPEALG